MNHDEARRIAIHAFEGSAFPHEQVLRVLIDFGLVKIDEPESVAGSPAWHFIAGENVLVDDANPHGGYRGPLSNSSAAELIDCLNANGFKIVRASE